MGPSSEVQPDHVGEKEMIVAAADDRQCGRCRQFFPADRTSTPVSWWACPPCRLALFGAE